MSAQKNKDNKPYHHGDLYDTLINTAAKILKEEGVGAVSLRRIAKEVGVSAPAVYHHFQNHTDLLTKLAIIGFNQLYEQTSSAIRSVTDPDEKTKQYGIELVRFSLENQHLHKLMFESSEVEEALMKGDFLDNQKAHYQLIIDVTTERIKKWDLRTSPETLALATFCSFHGLCQTLKDNRSSNLIRHFTGYEDAQSLDIKLTLSDIISEIFIGRHIPENTQ